MHIAFLPPGWSTKIGVNYPMWRSLGLSADGDGDYLVFGNVVPVENDSFGSKIRQVVAFDVCVSSDFVQYRDKSYFGYV